MEYTFVGFSGDCLESGQPLVCGETVTLPATPEGADARKIELGLLVPVNTSSAPAALPAPTGESTETKEPGV